MPVGTTLLAGRYRTIERVGSGGMATVWLAEDERLGRQVAVKVLHAESPEDTAQRFRREARLGASLNHPNIVSIFDIESEDEGVLIVMEYVEGETLRDVIERGPTSPERALEILRGVADALDHAHGEGIVHRDVKPANVLIGSDGRVKLADLGIATAVEGTRITMSGVVLGTASYMAPEQLEGSGKPGPAADVYSLAVVAWEVLSGQRAYSGGTALSTAHRKLTEPPPVLNDAWPAAPQAVSDVLARAMGTDVRARPLTAGSLVDELEQAFGQTAATAALPDRKPAKPLAGAAAAGAGAAAATAPDAHAAAPAMTPSPARTTPRAAEPVDGAANGGASRGGTPGGGATRGGAGNGGGALPMATHRGARGGSRFLPLVALVIALALGAAAIIAFAGGGSDSKTSGGKHTAKAKSKSHRKPAKEKDAQPAPAQSSAPPATTTPAATPPATDTPAPSTSGYEVPSPHGTSAAEGARLNDQGKALSDQGNYGQAIPVLEKAVRSYPPGTTAAGNLQFAFTLFNLGHALVANGRPADAIPVLEERLKNPDQRGTVQAELDRARAAAGQD